MDQVDTLHVGRYWSEVLCCTITLELPRGQGHGSILIDLVAKHKSGELRCPATALIYYGNLICSIYPLIETKSEVKFLALQLSLGSAGSFIPHPYSSQGHNNCHSQLRFEPKTSWTTVLQSIPVCYTTKERKK